MEEKIENQNDNFDEITKPTEVELSLELQPKLAEDNQEVDIFEENFEETSETKTPEKNIDKIYGFISSLKQDLEVRNERDKYKDEAIQRMSKQIASFEKGVFEIIKKELISEIISFYDLLLKFQEKFQTLENKEFQNEVDFLETELSNILFNNSIDEIDENIGEKFDRDIHRIKQKTETKDLEEDQKIIKILKKGFVWNEKVIRKQEVVIAEYKEPLDE